MTHIATASWTPELTERSAARRRLSDKKVGGD